MSFYNLPCEVLEQIFNELNGISLVRAKCVCSHWKSVIENASRVRDLWKKVVIKEIPEDMLLDIIGGVDLSDDTNVEDSQLNDDTEVKPENAHRKVPFSTVKASYLPLDWSRVYKIWYCASKTKTWNHYMKVLSMAGTFPVTCCKVSGSWIITSHRNGSICSWDWKNRLLHHVILQHLKMVTDFALFDLLKNDSYGDPHRPFKHHHIVSVSKDHTIQVSPLFGPSSSEPDEDSKSIFRYHSNTLDRVRAFGNSFAVSCVDKTISIWRMDLPISPWSKAAVQKIYVLYPYGPDPWSFMGFWKNQILCFCNNGRFIRFSKETSCWDQDEAYVEPQYSDLHIVLSNSECDMECLVNTSVHIYWGNVVFLLTIDRNLWISLDGEVYKRYRAIEELGSSVLCICLRAGLLAMGLERGKLVLFQLNHPKDILSLEISKPTWCKQLSEASILSVDISERPSGYPVVAATTTETVFVIHWKPQS